MDTRKLPQATEDNPCHGDPPGSLCRPGGGFSLTLAFFRGPGGSGPMIKGSRKVNEDSFRRDHSPIAYAAE